MHKALALVTALILAVAALAATARAQTPAAAAFDGVRMCRDQNAKQRQKLNTEELPAVVQRLGLFLASDTICSCVERQLRANGGVMVHEADVARLMKANGLCMSAELNATFPAQCVDRYRELLPLMGYSAATDAQLGAVCQCATRAVRERLTPDALYAAQMSGFEESQARGAGKQPVSKAPAADPFQKWLAQLHSCATATLGEPAKN